MGVVLNLGRHPSHIPRFVRHNIFSRKSPLELGLPWWPYRPIDKFCEVLQRRNRVFEWGCGGSTVFAAQHGATIFAVEDSLQWMQRCQDRCNALNLKTVSWKHVELPSPVSDPVELDAYVEDLDSERYDIVIIDGHAQPYSNRERCFLHPETMALPRALIILDDTWRHRDLLSQCKARKIEVCASTGPSRNNVSETAFCWY
jgi:hypothetical protein